MDPVAQIRKQSLADSAILSRAIIDSFRKLNPRTMVKNPVMFVVEVGAVLTTIQLLWDICFSPYGEAGRVTAPFAIALCMLAARELPRYVPGPSAARDP